MDKIFFPAHLTIAPHLQLLPGTGGPLLERLDLAAGEVLLGAAGDVAPELKRVNTICCNVHKGPLLKQPIKL